MADTLESALGVVTAMPAGSYVRVLYNAAGTLVSRNLDMIFAHGFYAPTESNTSNVSAITAGSCQYMRVGDVVTISGLVVVDVTAAGATSFELSLPVASNFSAITQAAGIASAYVGSAPNETAQISASIANNTLVFQYYATATTSLNWLFHCTYVIL